MFCAVYMEHGSFGGDMGMATKLWNERYLNETDGLKSN
jgi:hypothetical protein